MRLKGKKIGILIEGDYYEHEIWYYRFRFPEEGAEIHFLSRLWGQPRLTFLGHEYKVPFECSESFENMSDDELKSYSAIIVPAGMVADRLRYTEDISKLPPAAELMKRAFAQKQIIKGIICHGMWLMSPISEIVKGRRAVVHNNLLGDAKNYGLDYIDEDVVVDNDLVTARTGGHCHLFAKKIIELLSRSLGGLMTSAEFAHIGVVCKDPIKIEKFYTKHFGFTRAWVFAPGPDQVVIIRSENLALELFKATAERPDKAPAEAGPMYPCWRHVCFIVDDLEAKLKELGNEVKITLGPLDMKQFIPGMKVVWVADPEGNIIELNQGYRDEKNPPPLP